jgi:hypothetical protein
MDTMEDPVQIEKLNNELLVTLYQSRSSSLGSKVFMVQQSMMNMTFATDEDRTKMYQTVSEANGIPHEQDVLMLYRDELLKRLASG